MADFFEHGLTEIDWTEIDQGMGPLLASPADVGGRGIRVFIGPGGAGADLAGATVWLLWRHRQTHAAGAEPFEGAAGQVGVFCVRYPEAMAAAEGEAECQIVVRGADGRRLSSREFAVRVGSDVAGSLAPCEGGRFLDVIERCGAAAEEARGAAEELRAAAASGEFDGADGTPGADGRDGVDGKDGVSPSVSVEQTETGAVLTVTDAAGTTTAVLSAGGPGRPAVLLCGSGLDPYGDDEPQPLPFGAGDIREGDLVIDAERLLFRAGAVVEGAGGEVSAALEFITSLGGSRFFYTSEEGPGFNYSSSSIKADFHGLVPGDIGISYTSGNLFQVTDAWKSDRTGSYYYSARNICELATKGYVEKTVAGAPAPDLSAYATKEYVVQQIAALEDLSEVTF